MLITFLNVCNLYRFFSYLCKLFQGQKKIPCRLEYTYRSLEKFVLPCYRYVKIQRIN